MTYLGPLGNLQRIHPLVDLGTTAERLGGVHTGLSGARTVDYLGSAATYELSFARQTPNEHAWLEALHHRHIPGPLRLLLDSLKRNRLSRSAASVGYGGREDLAGLIDASTGTFTWSRKWPSAAAPTGAGLVWSGWEATHEVQLDKSAPVPVLGGETVTMSWWVLATHDETVALAYEPADRQGTLQGFFERDTAEHTLTAGTWTRLAWTTSPAWPALSPGLEVVTRTSAESTLTLAAPQVETGSQATAWQQGGGAPVVAVDAMPTSSPYAPYITPDLTLVEL